jgi:hypothetical protein
MCIVFWPCTAGDVLKWKRIVVLPLMMTSLFDGLPFTVKSLGWTVAGSTAPVSSTEKSVGGVKTVIPQAGLVTEQGAEVGVGVGVAVAVTVAVGVGLGVPQGCNV